MVPALVVFSAICVLGLTSQFPRIACVLWILALETSPDSWLDNLIGEHETIIGVMKAFGLVLVVILALRNGLKADRYNPGFAFGAMFLIGLMHGLYPGLSLLSSIRSLIGSAGPFLFGFTRLPPAFIRAVQRATIWGPLFTVSFGGLLAITGLDHMYVVEQGALRLGASGEPPFLAGFALIGVYAGLMECLRTPSRAEALMVVVNFIIILLTGARTPLALALFVTFSVLVLQRRLLMLAAAGAVACLGLIFLNALSFLRVIDLAQLGEASNLSNRDLVWPYFQTAFKASPFFGWGVGAGKVIIPVTSHLTSLIGTNAAHDEFLRIGSEGGIFGLGLLIILIFLWVKRGSEKLPRGRRWLMRLIFLGFIFHSATDNTLIATTSSVFFIWVSCVFATAHEGSKATA
jgi:O-antigen ligase